MIEEVQGFIVSESNLSYGEMWQINEDLINLDWLNIIGKISNKEYLEQVLLKSEKPSINTLCFGKDTIKFSAVLNQLFGEKEGQAKFTHELEHAKICEKHKIDYFFGIMKFSDIKRKNGFIERNIQPFIQASDYDLVLLKPKERILFHIENNKSPKDMSEGDRKAAKFWEEKLMEFEKPNNSKNTSQ